MEGRLFRKEALHGPDIRSCLESLFTVLPLGEYLREREKSNLYFGRDALMRNMELVRVRLIITVQRAESRDHFMRRMRERCAIHCLEDHREDVGMMTLENGY